jgi:hypothetical protein
VIKKSALSLIEQQPPVMKFMVVLIIAIVLAMTGWVYARAEAHLAAPRNHANTTSEGVHASIAPKHIACKVVITPPWVSALE